MVVEYRVIMYGKFGGCGVAFAARLGAMNYSICIADRQIRPFDRLMHLLRILIHHLAYLNT